MELRGKLINVSRPYYQVQETHAIACVSFVIADAKGKSHFFSINCKDFIRTIMISALDDEMLLELNYNKECALHKDYYSIRKIVNLTLGFEKLERVEAGCVSGKLIRVSRAFCLVESTCCGVDSFQHYSHEIISRALLVLRVKGKLIIAETDNMSVIQFLQMSRTEDLLSVKFSSSQEIAYIRNKNLGITYETNKKN